MDEFYEGNLELSTELKGKELIFVTDLAINMLVYIEKPVVRMPEKVNRKDEILFPKF
jgi:hypothetical protein